MCRYYFGLVASVVEFGIITANTKERKDSVDELDKEGIDGSDESRVRRR